ncbi:MAG: hypothetical protein SYR96_12585 [Actinomycetota bacterium]|nr:hypothetical protein [Actinomycetota bacterium]
MSYPAVQPPPAATVSPPSPAGRPPTVAFAAALLWLMAGVGLVYAIATLAIVPGTIDRFRDVTGDPQVFQRFGDNSDPEYYVAVVWLGAAVALALAVIAFALFVVVGLSLRRGSNMARITTLVVCVLGILGGGGAVLTLAAQQSGDADPSSLGSQLSGAYPGGWIGTNAALAVAQVLGYTLVGILILTAPRAFFRRPATPAFGASLPAFGPGRPVGYPAAVSGGYLAGYPGAGSVGHPPPGAPPGAPASATPGGTQPMWDPAGPHHSWDPRPLPGSPQPASGHPGAAYPGYGPAGYPAPGYAQPSPHVSPYARPADQARDAAFASQAPAAPSMPATPPPDPDSPYARPQTHADTTAPDPDDTTTSQNPPADPDSPYALPAPAPANTQSAPAPPAAPVEPEGPGVPPSAADRPVPAAAPAPPEGPGIPRVVPVTGQPAPTADPAASQATPAAGQIRPAAEVAEAGATPSSAVEQPDADEAPEVRPSGGEEATSGEAGQGAGTPKPPTP